jgi:hypothetical protein
MGLFDNKVFAEWWNHWMSRIHSKSTWTGPLLPEGPSVANAEISGNYEKSDAQQTSKIREP